MDSKANEMETTKKLINSKITYENISKEDEIIINKYITPKEKQKNF